VEDCELGLCSEKICCYLKNSRLINIRIIVFLLVGTLLFFLLLRYQGNNLVTPYSPKGIVSLELAGTKPATTEIISGWKHDGRGHSLRNNLLIDFCFIPFYVMLFYTLCGSISVRLDSIAAKLGVLLAFFILIGGGFDVLENILMMLAYLEIYNTLTVKATFSFAILKFILISLSIIYVIVFGSVVIRKKLSRHK